MADHHLRIRKAGLVLLMHDHPLVAMRRQHGFSPVLYCHA
jgi:hypothetical protein